MGRFRNTVNNTWVRKREKGQRKEDREKKDGERKDQERGGSLKTLVVRKEIERRQRAESNPKRRREREEDL